MSSFNEADHPRHGDGRWAAKERGEVDPGFGFETTERSNGDVVAEARQILDRLGDTIAEWESREPHVDVVHGIRWDSDGGGYVEYGRRPDEPVRSARVEEDTLETPAPLSVDDYRTWYGFDPEAAEEDGYRQNDLWVFDSDQMEDWRAWNSHLSELRRIEQDLGIFTASIENYGDEIEGAHKALAETLERAERAGVVGQPSESEPEREPLEDEPEPAEDDWF